MPSGLISLWVTQVRLGNKLRPNSCLYFASEQDAFSSADKMWEDERRRYSGCRVYVTHTAGISINGRIHVCHIAPTTVQGKDHHNGL